MRKFILLFLILLGSVTVGYAQKSNHGKNHGKEVLEFKLKYLAQEMDLNEDQQPKFFEFYTRMNNEKFALFKELRQLERKIKDGKATEAEYEAYSKASANAKIKIAEIDKSYEAKFSQFLSAKQLYKLKEAEETFRKKMREMHHKRKK
ncbi:MAG: hypothetical protein NC328_05605 [Muribaculum sp.]|nr:hypothetical protein [Muribaculum sp.]